MGNEDLLQDVKESQMIPKHRIIQSQMILCFGKFCMAAMCRMTGYYYGVIMEWILSRQRKTLECT